MPEKAAFFHFFQRFVAIPCEISGLAIRFGRSKYCAAGGSPNVFYSRDVGLVNTEPSTNRHQCTGLLGSHHLGGNPIATIVGVEVNVLKALLECPIQGF